MDNISSLHKDIINLLDSNKALDIVSIDLDGKSSIADQMIIASGTSSRHIQACLLYTSPSPRDGTKSRMPSSA